MEKQQTDTQITTDDKHMRDSMETFLCKDYCIICKFSRRCVLTPILFTINVLLASNKYLFFPMIDKQEQVHPPPPPSEDLLQ